MSKIALQGNVSGTGTISLVAPNTSTDRTLTLPDAAGTLDRLERAGNVLQVVSASTATNTSTSSTTYVAVTNLTASITPSSATNKVLVFVNMNFYVQSVGAEGAITIYRNGSDLTGGNGFADVYTGSSDIIAQAPMLYLDSPATTSSTTYAVYMKRTQGANTIQTNLRGTTSTITLMEIAA